MTCLSHSHGKVYCHQRTQIVVSDKRRLRPICFVSVKKSRTQYVLLLSRGGSLPICFQYHTIEHNIKTIHIIHYKDNTHNTLKDNTIQRKYNRCVWQEIEFYRILAPFVLSVGGESLHWYHHQIHGQNFGTISALIYFFYLNDVLNKIKIREGFQ